VRFVIIKNHPNKLKENWFFFPVENLKRTAMPKIIAIFIEKIFNL
jgi:A/G-specific adenine glycosylase